MTRGRGLYADESYTDESYTDESYTDEGSIRVNIRLCAMWFTCQITWRERGKGRAVVLRGRGLYADEDSTRTRTLRGRGLYADEDYTHTCIRMKDEGCRMKVAGYPLNVW